MAQIPYELLLSLAYVSGISDSEAVRARFFESLVEIDPTYRFDYSLNYPQPVFAQEVVSIATLHSSFGYALMRKTPPDERLPDRNPREQVDPAIFRTAFRFLAVLLENRAQAKALEAEKTSLEGEVSRRNAQIREQEKRYSDIFGNRHIVMLIIDPEVGRIVDANPATLKSTRDRSCPRVYPCSSRLSTTSLQDLRPRTSCGDQSRRDDPETEFLKAQNRISTLSLIHEKLYQSEHSDRIDFGDYIESIVTMVVSAYSPKPTEITYEVDIEPIKLDIDRVQPCGLIVNELVTNAIKHAFVGSLSGHFTVKARRVEEGRISLSVSDDGHSIRHDGAGIGLQLVDTLVKQLGGVMRSNTSERGTRIEVVFPEA
jgi:two-component sensor histidine kinase